MPKQARSSLAMPSEHLININHSLKNLTTMLFQHTGTAGSAGVIDELESRMPVGIGFLSDCIWLAVYRGRAGELR
jgi:hypothetical protein